MQKDMLDSVFVDSCLRSFRGVLTDCRTYFRYVEMGAVRAFTRLVERVIDGSFIRYLGGIDEGMVDILR